MEHDFLTLWRALAPGDLPGPVPEYRFHPVRRWRFDFAWPAERGGLALEVDGGQWMAGGGRHNGDKDREKLNVAACLGWRVLRVTPRDLETDPAGCVELVAAALILGAGGPGPEFDPASGPVMDAFRGASGGLPGGSASVIQRQNSGPAARKKQLTARETRPARATLQRRQPLTLQRRPGLKLARPQPVKLARRGGDPRADDPAGGDRSKG